LEWRIQGGKIVSTLRWATVTALVLTAGSTAAEEIVVEGGVFGFAGMGEVFTLAEDHFYWVGKLTGTETNPGAGLFEHVATQCPGWLDIDVAAGMQRGAGYCTNILPSGDTFVNTWSCEGTIEPNVCNGPHEVVEGSGTGALEGLTGTGTFEGTADVPHADGITSSYTVINWTFTLP
jgi:hypothetical protein